MGRFFALLLMVAGCGDDTFDPNAVGISGTWSTRVENIGEPPGNDEAIVCTATWTMEIVESAGAGASGDLSSEVPLDARIECTDGYASLFAHRGLDLVVLRDGATVNFVTASRGEPFATVTLVSGSRLEGRMSELYYGGGDLTATR